LWDALYLWLNHTPAREKERTKRRQIKERKGENEIENEKNWQFAQIRQRMEAKSPEHQAKRKKEKKKNENETHTEKNESDAQETRPKPVAKVPQLVKRRTLLVIGGKASIDWPEVFKGATLHAGLVDVTVEMASWEGTF
jgi:ATP-dependent 26S proteasome regulatory subunit